MAPTTLGPHAVRERGQGIGGVVAHAQYTYYPDKTPTSGADSAAGGGFLASITRDVCDRAPTLAVDALANALGQLDAVDGLVHEERRPRAQACCKCLLNGKRWRRRESNLTEPFNNLQPGRDPAAFSDDNDAFTYGHQLTPLDPSCRSPWPQRGHSLHRSRAQRAAVQNGSAEDPRHLDDGTVPAVSLALVRAQTDRLVTPHASARLIHLARWRTSNTDEISFDS